MTNAIDNTFRLSLTYPNPSLCQTNNAVNERRQSDEQPLSKSEELVVAKHTTSRLSQGVLVTWYAGQCFQWTKLICSNSLLLGLLFSSLDTSIASTSLITISRELQDFENAPWIVLAYLLTYMGMEIENPPGQTRFLIV